MPQTFQQTSSTELPIEVVSNHLLFTVVIDLYGAPKSSVDSLLLTLHEQTYKNYEVLVLHERWIPNPNSSLCRGVFVDRNLQVRDLLSGRGKSAYRGDYILFLHPQSVLRKNALSTLNQRVSEFSALNSPDIVLFDFEAMSPKKIQNRLPGWDPDLIQQLDYIQGACIISARIIKDSSSTAQFDTLWSLLKSLSKSKCSVVHIQTILAVLPQIAEKALKISPSDKPSPPLTVIIPNKNRPDLLLKCTKFLHDLKSPLQLIIIDNQSDDPEVWTLYKTLSSKLDVIVVPYNLPFNYSAMINKGIENAKYPFTLLLNNDVFVSSADSVRVALDYIREEQIGVVGSVLRYPNGGVQHAGIVLMKNSEDDFDTKHVLRFERDQENGHIGALTAPRNWQCVTGAFQLIRKSLFCEVGGYDEVNLPIEFNDIDFCLRVRSKGYRVVCLPLDNIIHDESQTRSKIDRSRALESATDAYQIMRMRWRREYCSDPFLGPERADSEGIINRDKAWCGRLATLTSSIIARFTISDARLSECREMQLAARTKLKPQLQTGVSIIGPFAEASVAGDVTRGIRSACDAEGIPISIIDISAGGLVSNLSTMCHPYPDRMINFIVLSSSTILKKFRVPTEGRKTIAYLLDSLLEDSCMIQHFEEYDEVWLETEMLKDEIEHGSAREIPVDESNESTYFYLARKLSTLCCSLGAQITRK